MGREQKEQRGLRRFEISNSQSAIGFEIDITGLDPVIHLVREGPLHMGS